MAKECQLQSTGSPRLKMRLEPSIQAEWAEAPHGLRPNESSCACPSYKRPLEHTLSVSTSLQSSERFTKSPRPAAHSTVRSTVPVEDLRRHRANAGRHPHPAGYF